MKKRNQKHFCIAVCMLIAFVTWTGAIRFIDVQAIGPQESSVGFATINKFVHNLTGVHIALYTITDWLGLVPFAFVMGFALLGLVQWIKRKHLLKVDYSILILGGFYIAVMAVYVLFEMLVVNFRPVLIDGILEASYPSSTTMLVMCVMPTAIMQFNARIKNSVLKRFVATAIIAFIVFMVIGRLVSGVHWLTDIIGGALLSAGLVLMYHAIIMLRQTETSEPDGSDVFLYVLNMHELCHFIHSNHSRAFYDFLTMLMPDWKESKQFLDKTASYWL